jgi:hypothetical protein
MPSAVQNNGTAILLVAGANQRYDRITDVRDTTRLEAYSMTDNSPAEQEKSEVKAELLAEVERGTLHE